MICRSGRYAAIVLLVAIGVAMAAEDTPPAADRASVVRAMLDRSRLLGDTRFTIPTDLWTQYLRETSIEPDTGPPVDMIISAATYTIVVHGPDRATLDVEMDLHVFRPEKCRNTPLLPGGHAFGWTITVNGRETKLETIDWRVRFSPDEPGLYVIKATMPMTTPNSALWPADMPIVHSVQTSAAIDADDVWEVAVKGDPRRILGTATDGTHGRLSLTGRTHLTLIARRLRVERAKPPRYQVRGDIAWNIDEGRQQIAARLHVTILDGSTTHLSLGLPAKADRIEVTGPDIRDVQARGGNADVFLRGKIAGQTVLNLKYELPAAEQAHLQKIAIGSSPWIGGTVVITNTTESSEIIENHLLHVRPLAVSDAGPEVRAMLAGPAVLAYEITGRNWGVDVDIVNLGEYALRESLADLAHYEFLGRDDGAVLTRTRYEIRNRNRQFLEVRLPAGHEPLLATVDEQPVALTPTGEANVYRLPLKRSLPSVKGLISFPVELVTLGRGEPMAAGATTSIRLPQIDLPIAYGWCEAYLPDGLEVENVSGLLGRVDRYSSESATAHLDYGRGIISSEGMAGEPVSNGMTHSLRISLGANYYRAGSEFYAAGKYDEAAKALEQAQIFAGDTVSGLNSARLLSNIEVAKGTAGASGGRAAKVAAAQVRRSIRRSNESLLRQQQQFAEQSVAEARLGRTVKAERLRKGAEILSKQLVARGESKLDQESRLRAARKAVPRHIAAQSASASQVARALVNHRGRAPEASRQATRPAAKPAPAPADAQIELGAVITLQELAQTDGSSTLRGGQGGGTPYYESLAYPSDPNFGAGVADKDDEQIERFIASNYGPQGAVEPPGSAIYAGVRIHMLDQLNRNRGQKVSTANVNVNVDAVAALVIGVQFKQGRNDVRYAVIDEGQFRTLRELGARKAATVDTSVIRQDTIVGTDARLANRNKAYLGFAADASNTWWVNGNSVELPHAKYLLIDNDGYLTAMRAGQMQHWTDSSNPIELTEAPQSLRIPHTGQLIKLERTLVKATDELVVRIRYAK